MSDSTAPDRPRLYPRKYLLRVAWINLGAAVVAVLLLMWFRTLGLRDMTYALVSSVTYSYAIGTPSALLLPLVARRVEKRPAWMKIAALGSSIAVLTVAGCLVANLLLTLIGVESAAVIWARFGFAVRFSVLIALAIGLSVYFFESLRSQLQETTLQLRTRQLGEERAKKLAAEARLSLLNLDWVQEVNSWFADGVLVRLKDDKHTELPVARDRVRALKERLGF